MKVYQACRVIMLATIKWWVAGEVFRSTQNGQGALVIQLVPEVMVLVTQAEPMVTEHMDTWLDGLGQGFHALVMGIGLGDGDRGINGIGILVR
jgi:NAD(P)H-hydrate repair Nnr-like enzyme with NAD(P)H-hydrate dehydratase domain